MKIDMDILQRKLIPEAMTGPSSGDPWLDQRYGECTNLYYRLFYLIAKEFKPEFSVELGTYRAVAAGHLAAGNPDGYVCAVDIHREDKVAQQCARDMDAHFKNLVYVNGWTWDDHVMFRIASLSGLHPIDILFIDAWHRYEYAMREWNIYEHMLANEALIICDDISTDAYAENMVQFWDELRVGYDSFLNVGLHERIPMGFMRYIT